MPEVERSFLKDLKSMDRRLGTKFNGRNFVVTYDRGHGEPVNIHLVKAGDGGFRQPDRRDLEIIKGGDLECGDSMTHRLQRRAYASECMRRDMRRKAHEEIHAMTRDNRRQIINTVLRKANERKANSTFRRVELKRKGRTAKEIMGEA